MPTAGRQRHRAAARAEVHRSGGGRAEDVLAGAVTETPVTAETPAARGAIVEQGARVVVAGGDGDRREPERHRWQRPGSLVVADVHHVAGPQATVRAASPAPDATVIEHGARVREAGGDGGGAPSGSQVDHPRRSAGNDRGPVLVGACPQLVAKPSVLIEAPAARGAVLDDGTGVVEAGGDRAGLPAGDGHRAGGRRIGHIGAGSVPQAPTRAEAPAPHRGVAEDGTCVLAPGVQVAALQRTDLRRSLFGGSRRRPQGAAADNEHQGAQRERCLSIRPSWYHGSLRITTP